MFKFVTNFLKKHFLKDNDIIDIIEKQLNIKLHHRYKIYYVDEFPKEVLNSQREFQNMEGFEDEIPTAITIPYDKVDDDGIVGFVAFNINVIKDCLKDFGFFKSRVLIKEIVIHEIRHCDQFEFLRLFGGGELINKVCEDQKGVPYFKNILEIDAYNYQFNHGDRRKVQPLDVVFAQYISVGNDKDKK